MRPLAAAPRTPPFPWLWAFSAASRDYQSRSRGSIKRPTGRWGRHCLLDRLPPAPSRWGNIKHAQLCSQRYLKVGGGAQGDIPTPGQGADLLFPWPRFLQGPCHRPFLRLPGVRRLLTLDMNHHKNLSDCFKPMQWSAYPHIGSSAASLALCWSAIEGLPLVLARHTTDQRGGYENQCSGKSARRHGCLRPRGRLCRLVHSTPM